MKQVGIAILTIVFAVSLAALAIYADFSDSESGEGNTVQAGSLDLQLADFDEDFGYLGDGVIQSWYYAGTYPPGMAPGDSLESAVYLRNIGTLAADHLDIYCSIVNVEIDADTDAENEKENILLINNGGGVDNDKDGLVDEDDVDDMDNDGDGLIDEDPDPLTGPIPDTQNRGVYNKDTVMIINYMKYQNASTVDIVWDDGQQWDILYIDDVDGDGIITLYDFKHHGITELPPPESGLSGLSMKVTFGDASVELNEYQGDQTQMTIVFALFQ